jgi:hypothetical protein
MKRDSTSSSVTGRAVDWLVETSTSPTETEAQWPLYEIVTVTVHTVGQVWRETSLFSVRRNRYGQASRLICKRVEAQLKGTPHAHIILGERLWNCCFPKKVLYGGPGSGNSTLRDALSTVAKMNNIFFRKTSYTATSEVDIGGKAICMDVGSKDDEPGLPGLQDGNASDDDDDDEAGLPGLHA